MNDHTVSNIDAHVSVVTDHISRLLVRVADRSSAYSQRTGLPWHGNAKMCMNQIDKSGTVRSVCQTVAAEYIRTSDKLLPVRCNGAAPSAASSGRARRTAA